MNAAPLLVTPDELARGLGGVPAAEGARSPDGRGESPWIAVDCRFELTRPAAGPAAFAAGHIPGARYADLDRDLAAARGPATGRHPLPAPEDFLARLAAWGVGPGARVVAYDEGSGAFAARFWWLCRWVGHDQVSLLDGGYRAWCDAGLPVSSVAEPATPGPAHVPSHVEGAPGMPVVSAEALAPLVKAGELLLVDVRGRERFRGEVEPIDPVAGHVPGAVNVPFSEHLGPDGRFLSREALHRRYRDVLAGRPGHAVAFMCGSGVTACHGIFALELAGWPGARLYPGSWSEWIRNPERPVAVG